MRDVLLFGGRIVVRKFDTPRDLTALDEPLIVNCTGLGARALFGDLELTARLAAARSGGGAHAVKRHREQGKLLARERIEKLLDPDTPFLEIGALASYGLYDGAAPSAGIVTGIGRVSGREVMTRPAVTLERSS